MPVATPPQWPRPWWIDTAARVRIGDHELEGRRGTAGPRVSGRDVRASDGERELVVERLQRAMGQGRLATDEFEQRAAAAYAATTRGELADLTRDLPGHLW